MNYKDMIKVANAKVATYDPSSKLSFEYPGVEHFSDARDLKILKKTDHITLLADFCNMQALKNTPKGINTTLTVSLTDTDSGKLVGTRMLSLKLKRSEFRISERIDFNVEFDHTREMLNYGIQVCAENGEVLLYIPVRLYDLTVLKLLPTRFYCVEAAAVVRSCDFSYRPMKSLGRGYDSRSAEIDFTLANMLPDGVELPELQLRVVHPDGCEQCEFLRPVSIEGRLSDPREGKVVVHSRLNFRDDARPGIYYAELRSMGYAIAGFVFSTDGEAVDGEWRGDGIAPAGHYSTSLGEQRLKTMLCEQTAAECPGTESAEAPERGIDNLVGLQSVKTRLKAYTNLVRFNRMRLEHRLPQMPLSLHAMFLGSPGTGKTTVARIIGKTLHDIGVLSSGHVVVCERSTLLGKYYHSEAENVRNALDQARGGILFIDEAYQLYQPDDPKDPGKFVIESLLTAMADETDRDWMLILAGYPEPMKRMFDMNPGLRSRIPQSNIYTFEDFTSCELMEIALAHLERYRFTLEPDAEAALRKRLSADYAGRGDDFGNARHVVNLIENEILPAMATRLAGIASPGIDDLSRIIAADIPAPAPVLQPRIRRLGFAV